MDSPAQAVTLAVARSASNSSSRRGPAALGAAASSRQLQLASPSSGNAAQRKVPLIRLSVCQTLTKPIAGTDGDGAAGDTQAAAVSRKSTGVSAASEDHANGAAPAAAEAGTSAAAGAAAATAGSGPSSSLVAAGRTGAAGGSSSGGSSNSLVTAGVAGSKSAVNKAAIMSFRKVEVLMGALDLKTDQVGSAVSVLTVGLRTCQLCKHAATSSTNLLLTYQPGTACGVTGPLAACLWYQAQVCLHLCPSAHMSVWNVLECV